MRTQILTKFDSWVERRLTLPGDHIETITAKKRFWFFLLPNPFFMALAGLGFWIFDAWSFAIGIWLFGFLMFISLLLFSFVRNHVNWFVMVTMYIFVLFSFAAVLYFGGIINSGGVVFVGLAGAVASLTYLRPGQVRVIFGVYLITIILEALLQPYLVLRPEITPTINLVSFVLHIMVITGVMFMTISYFIEQSILAKQNEADKLRELNRLKTHFYTNITHEFRTPLTVILGMVDQIAEKPREHFQNGLNLIRRNANRLLYLVKQMLNLSKLEAGAVPINNIQGDILQFLRVIIEPFKHLAEEKNIHFHFLCDLDKIILDFDPEKIETLIGNLLSNAIKYSPEGSDIYCIVEVVESIPNPTGPILTFGSEPKQSAQQAEKGKQLKISIKDTGPGIPAAHLNRIFDRFYQVGDEISRREEGTGIGLSLVKELVNLLGGDIQVKSNAKQGTTFTVYLPVSIQASTINAEKYMITQDLAPESIYAEGGVVDKGNLSKKSPRLLIVEDNEDVVLYLRAILEHDYQIEVSINGADGISKAIKIIPDIIVSDVMMPGKDGFELCRTLKSDFRTSHIPIVLLTAKADVPSKITGLEEGADAYLTKPFNSEELQVRLHKLIELREKLKLKFRLVAITPLPEDKPVSLDEMFMHNLQQVLQENYENENLDTNQFAQKIGLSRVQLFRKLKALTGYSASHILRTFRLNKAKELVQTTDYNISEIAFEVGFKDPAYFTRAFTKEFGFAPSTLRPNKT